MCEPTALTLETGPRPWGFWATLGFSFAVLGASIVVSMIVTAIFTIFAVIQNPEIDIWEYLVSLASNGFCFAVTTIISATICTAMVVLFAKLRKGITIKTYLALRTPSRKQLVKWFLVLGLFMVLSDALTLSLGQPIVPEFMVEMYRTAYFTPVLLIALLLMSPVFEETFMRGFLFEGIKHSRLGSSGAVILTAAVWSALHIQYDLYGIATVFVGGLLLGIARLKSGSVYLTIAMHSLWSLVATLETAVYAGMST